MSHLKMPTIKEEFGDTLTTALEGWNAVTGDIIPPVTKSCQPLSTTTTQSVSNPSPTASTSSPSTTSTSRLSNVNLTYPGIASVHVNPSNARQGLLNKVENPNTNRPFISTRNNKFVPIGSNVQQTNISSSFTVELQLKQTQEQLKEVTQKLTDNQNSYEILEKKYDQLKEDHLELKSNSNKSIEQLMADNAKLHDKLNQLMVNFNGFCGLVGENDDADSDPETEVDKQIGLDQDVIEDEPNAEVANDLMVRPDVDDSNQSSDNVNDLSLINESEHQIRSEKATRSARKQNSQCTKPTTEVNQQSIPSTSGLRSSGRKRIQRKMFAGDESNGQEVKSDKRKYTNKPRNPVKKVKPQNVDEIHQEEEEEEAKVQVVIFELNCTEPGCETILNSLELWKQHLSTCHGQMPYKQLEHSARLNQVSGQTEYPCTECEVVSKSRRLLIEHWRYYHHAGKFQCSNCDFVAKHHGKVLNHHQKNHSTRNKFKCTHRGCNLAFQTLVNLEIHKRVHSGETPYMCTWDNCEALFNQIGTAIRHVRMQHFHLPATVKEQKELNIIDERDPREYIECEANL